MIDMIKDDPFGFFLLYPILLCNCIGFGILLSVVLMP